MNDKYEAASREVEKARETLNGISRAIADDAIHGVTATDRMVAKYLNAKERHLVALGRLAALVDMEKELPPGVKAGGRLDFFDKAAAEEQRSVASELQPKDAYLAGVNHLPSHLSGSFTISVQVFDKYRNTSSYESGSHLPVASVDLQEDRGVVPEQVKYGHLNRQKSDIGNSSVINEHLFINQDASHAFFSSVDGAPVGAGVGASESTEGDPARSTDASGRGNEKTPGSCSCRES